MKIEGHIQDNTSAKIMIGPDRSVNGGQLRLFRSTHPISPDDIDPIRFPITTFDLTSEDIQDGFMDTSLAQNVMYYYVAAEISDGRITSYSKRIALATPAIGLPRLDEPEIWIDKLHYYLEIRDRSRIIKRYPIILGRDPIKRKLHQDFATTPEGVYKVTNRKLRSTFRHAFDIDYPNPTDRIRYDLLKSAGEVPAGKGIGGEIQIHGQLRNWRLERNWTWGCIALRNEDIDELFEITEIKVGTPVYIVGRQLTREDVRLIKREWKPEVIKNVQARLRELNHYQGAADGIIGGQTRLALGKYQMAKGYDVTCELDARTVADLLPSFRY